MGHIDGHKNGMLHDGDGNHVRPVYQTPAERYSDRLGYETLHGSDLEAAHKKYARELAAYEEHIKAHQDSEGKAVEEVERRLPALPLVKAAIYGGQWTVSIENVYEADGVQGFSLYDPDFPPYEVESYDRGGQFNLSEPQTRALYRRLVELLNERDRRR